MQSVCGLCLSVIGNESDEQSYIEKIRQEAVEEYKIGLLNEVGKAIDKHQGYPESLIAGIEIAYRLIESYNLPLK